MNQTSLNNNGDDSRALLEPLVGLEYGFAIYSIFEPMFESWMDDNDKAEFMVLALAATNKTLHDLDRDIATGVANGCPVETQIELCRRLHCSS
jgi:hypothetical protein